MSAFDLRSGITVLLARWMWCVAFAFQPVCAPADTVLPKDSGAAAQFEVPRTITNILELRTLTGEDYLNSGPLHITGTVTLVDTNRSLVVLQEGDAGAAFQFEMESPALSPGDLIALDASEGIPSVPGFPDYPYHPSGFDICRSFEAPSNWGDYHLTRMRALVRPPATGTYTFWIASDNSSELWLSQDADPRNVRRIALVPPGNWTSPREWTKFPAQKSPPIQLVAGRVYYLDAFQEQMTFADNIAVAWSGPGIGRSVIDGAYLAPWTESREHLISGNAGVLREYWTNYSTGNVTGLTGPRPFAGALTLRNARFNRIRRAPLPRPHKITLGKALAPEDDYKWIATDGYVEFAGIGNGSAEIEIAAGQNPVTVHVSGWDSRWPLPERNSRVRVEGVCGDVTQPGSLAPGNIWSSVIDGQPPIILLSTNRPGSADLSSLETTVSPSSDTPHTGFNVGSGVVTFNDRVLGTNYLYIQQGSEAMLLSQARREWGKNLKVGQLVQVSGPLLPGKTTPVFQPYSLAAIGSGTMPAPTLEWPETAGPGNQDGLWTEIEGVGRAVKPDGTLKVMRKRGPVLLWLGGTHRNSLETYVDATIRARGVVSLAVPGGPLLLVPSARFIDVEQRPQDSLFAHCILSTVQVKVLASAPPPLRRVRLKGVVTWSGPDSLFVQDAAGGICVKTAQTNTFVVGNQVEALGFPDFTGSSPALADAIVRQAGADQRVVAIPLSVKDLESESNSGALVTLRADFVSTENHDDYQSINLHEGHRPLEAILPRAAGTFATFQPDSRLEITGVYEGLQRTAANSDASELRGAPLSVARIWLRSPRDVVLVKGPPWLTWRVTLALIAFGSFILAVSLIRVYLLRLRLARQEGERLTFARELMRRQEVERRRIAGNLHDSLGQDLQVIKYQARLAMQPAANGLPLKDRLDQIEKAASQALEEVREITHDLRPYQLDQFGLTKAIRGIIERLSENSSIDFASHVDDIDGLFDNECQINIFRIVQEGLTNVIKHSGASEVTVVVKRLDSTVTVSIRDNGRGLDAGTASTSDRARAGFGLISIDERTRILGGTTTLNSKTGDGVNLTVQIPLPETHRDKESNSTDRG